MDFTNFYFIVWKHFVEWKRIRFSQFAQASHCNRQITNKLNEHIRMVTLNYMKFKPKLINITQIILVCKQLQIFFLLHFTR